MWDLSGRWLGLVVVTTGVIAVLLAGTASNADESGWRERYGKLLKIGGLLAVLVGTLQLAGLIFKAPPSLGPTPTHLLPPGMTMHRENAGSAGPDGWYLGESTQGRFSVETPAPFDDYTLETEAGPGNKVVVYGIGATVDDSLSFTVKEEIPAPGVSQRTLAEVEENERPFLRGPARRFNLDGFEGIEFETRNSPNGRYTRYLRLQNSSITMTLEFPQDKSNDASLIARRFLDSLKLQNAQKQSAGAKK